MPEPNRVPIRGEIWFIKLPTEPSDKPARPVIIVSPDTRNRHPRASTVLVVPLTTTMRDSVTHIRLLPGETGLAEISTAKAEDVTTVEKLSLISPRQPLRRISNYKICEIASLVLTAMGCPRLTP